MRPSRRPLPFKKIGPPKGGRSTISELLGARFRLNLAPGSVRLTARSPDHGLGPAIDVNGLLELPAPHLAIRVIRTRLDITVVAIGAAPFCALAVLESRVLCFRSAAAVLIVHRFADPVADGTAD